MNRNRTRRLAPATLLASLLLLASACRGAAPTVPPATGGPASPGAPAPGAAPIDWTAAGRVPLDERWVITDCDGDALLLCVEDRGVPAGTLELLRPLQGDPPRDGDEVAWLLDAHAGFVAWLAEDRATGCGDGYAVEAPAPAAATLDGRPAIAYTFTGRDAGGALRERGLAISTVDGHVRTLITANAYDPEGCPGVGTDAWTIEQLEAFSVHLPAVATRSRLPAAGSLEGVVVGRVLAVDAGQLSVDTVLMLSGSEALRAAIADGELPEGEDSLPNDVYVRDRSSDRLALRLAGDVAVLLYDCTRECEQVEVSAADWISGAVQALGSEHAPYELTVHAGAVVRVAELYLP